jgi:hypothetical protein
MSVKRREFFEMLSSILNVEDFKCDLDRQEISIYLPLKWEHIMEFKKTVLSFIGNPHTPDRKWEDDLTHAGYKIDSHYLEIDEATIKVDTTGRLYVDFEEVLDIPAVKEAVLENLLEDDAALERIAQKLMGKLIVEIPPIEHQPLPCEIKHHHRIHDPHHEHEDDPTP